MNITTHAKPANDCVDPASHYFNTIGASFYHQDAWDMENPKKTVTINFTPVQLQNLLSLVSSLYFYTVLLCNRAHCFSEFSD